MINFFLLNLSTVKIVERLYEYMKQKELSAYAVERACGVSNGYLGKQLKGKGSIGSDILERIKENYPELSLIWLVTGKGPMLIDLTLTPDAQLDFELNEEQQAYFTSKDVIIELLKTQIAQLQTTLADKDKLIALLEVKNSEQ